MIKSVRQFGKRTLKAFGLYQTYRMVVGHTKNLRIRAKNAGLRLRGAPDRLPIPPAELIYLVTGRHDVAWFIESGASASDEITRMLAKNGVSIADRRCILDFGCGCGRVMRHWNSLGGPVLHGTDYNSELVDWAKRHLQFCTFGLNGLAPPLSYEDDTFDFIYAISVLTHLPEPLQSAWICEFHRVLKPGGLLYITVHGPHFLPDLPPEGQDLFRAGHLVVLREELAGTNACAAFHPRSSIDELARGYTIVDYQAEWAASTGWQDGILLRAEKR